MCTEGKTMRKALMIAAVLLTLPPAAATGQGVNAAAARNVAVEVREDGRVVATSTVRLQLGRPAAISMNGPYSMRLRVDAAEGAGYTVRPNLQANGPQGWTPLRAQALTVAPGQRGTTLVERPSGSPLELAVSLD
jgi:hypothetical protein